MQINMLPPFLLTHFSACLHRMVAMCALVVILGASGFAQAEGVTDSEVIKVTMGKAEIVKLPGDVADIMVANPKIVDVSALQSDRLYLVGASIGDTNIIALDAGGNVLRKLDVHVRIDTVGIQKYDSRSISAGTQRNHPHGG